MSKLNDAQYEWSAFYQRFEDLCEDNDVTPQEVCKHTGISSATIALWRKAWYGDDDEEWDSDSETTDPGTYPSVNSLIKLSIYFNVSIDYLVGIRKSWLLEIINNRADILSPDRRKKLIEYADLLLLDQEHGQEHK